jgi:hypothetical protein
VHNEEEILNIFVVSDEAHLSSYINKQNSRYWRVNYSVQIHKNFSIVKRQLYAMTGPYFFEDKNLVVTMDSSMLQSLLGTEL